MPRLSGAGRSLAGVLGLVNAACVQFRPPPVPVPEPLTGPYHAEWSTSAGRSSSGGLVVMEGTVFLGGTDRTVFAVDLATGAIKWHRRLGGAILGGVVADGETVYAGTDRPQGAVAAMDAATGVQRWRTLRGRTGLPLAVGGGLVVMHDREGHVVALEAATGQVRWRRQVGVSLTAPVVLGDAILATTADSLFRLAPGDGAVLARA
ncbi:MAG TPA: PQQ-binding-like beta-propeller repeat protein, partial [Gemmatimonadales bacterium]|nr:PQQ-binding-like beta-propeller repeat protein [Gemmatimonadales bacterium]